MIAELLSVGTELLLGEIVDTNSAWLAQDLARRGVDVLWSQRVGDNRVRLKRAVEEALARSDLLIMCGGLGPTDDDMSREAVAETLGETPEVDAGLEEELRARFASFGVRMPERNLKQAWLIPSAEALPNPLGTAPGWLVRTERGGQEKVIVALPGPPRELKRMWLEEAVGRLELPPAALFTRTFKTQGIGESAVAERLGDLTLAANPSVATYAKRDGVHVRVAAKADTLAEAEGIAEEALGRVGEALQDFVWGFDGDELPSVIRRLLEAKGAKRRPHGNRDGRRARPEFERYKRSLARPWRRGSMGRADEGSLWRARASSQRPPRRVTRGRARDGRGRRAAFRDGVWSRHDRGNYGGRVRGRITRGLRGRFRSRRRSRGCGQKASVPAPRARLGQGEADVRGFGFFLGKAPHLTLRHGSAPQHYTSVPRVGIHK